MRTDAVQRSRHEHEADFGDDGIDLVVAGPNHRRISVLFEGGTGHHDGLSEVPLQGGVVLEGLVCALVVVHDDVLRELRHSSGSEGALSNLLY